MSISDVLRLYAFPDAESRQLCTPNATYNSVAEIDLEGLWNSGLRGLIFDRDGTLTRYHSPEVLPETVEKLAEAREMGFKMCGLSNASKARTASLEELSGKLGFPFFRSHPYSKPHPEAFLPTIDYFGMLPSQTAVIGDRILTDVLGGNRIGAHTILVKPFPNNGEPINLRVVRAYENILYRR